MNLAIAVLSGFLIWHFQVWTAGDGKLYIAFASLVPLSVYSNNYIDLMPSITILINTFIVSAIALAATMVFKLRWESLKTTARNFLTEFFTPVRLLQSALMILSVSWLVDLGFDAIRYNPNFIMKMFVIFMVMGALQQHLQRKTVYVLIGIAAIRIVFDRSVLTLDFLRSFIILILTWRLLRSFLRTAASDFSYECFSKEVKVSELEEGMHLAESIGRKEKLTEQDYKQFRKYPLMKTYFHEGHHYIIQPKGREKTGLVAPQPEGLSKRQIKNMHSYGLEKIRVCQTLPFAPMLFAGVILTILLKGNILILL